MPILRLSIQNLLQKNVHSTKLVSYLLDNVIPNLDKVKSAAEGAELELLRVLSELSATTDKLEDADAKLNSLFKKLLVRESFISQTFP